MRVDVGTEPTMMRRSEYLIDDPVAVAMTDAEARLAFGDFVVGRDRDVCATPPFDPPIEDVFAPEEITPALRAAYPAALATCRRQTGMSAAERKAWLRAYTPAIARGPAFRFYRTSEECA